MFARVTTTRGQAKKADVVRTIQQRLLPAIKGIQGFKGAYWLLDEKNGKGLAVSLWDSEDALNASAGPIGQLRTQSTNELGIEVESVESFEVIQTAGVPAEVSV
jgi:heme-degrading monooxygenase HmoA